MIISEFTIREKVKQVLITRWTYSYCEACDYPRHFRFDRSGVYHDEGCTCIDQERTRQRYVPSSYQEVTFVIEGLNEEDKANALKFWKL